MFQKPNRHPPAHKCRCFNTPDHRACNHPSYAFIRVRVRHYATGRRTWQTWYFCKLHFIQFSASAGQTWHALDRHGDRIADVVAYQLEGDATVTSVPP